MIICPIVESYEQTESIEIDLNTNRNLVYDKGDVLAYWGKEFNKIEQHLIPK